MNESTTKSFRFSASHSEGSKVIGKNYIMEVTTRALSAKEETEFEKTVESRLLRHLESRDLGLEVEFLKDIEITDANLLKVFWGLLEKGAPFVQILSLSLIRDSKTKTTVSI